MSLFALKLLLDGFWFLAISAPLLAGSPLWGKAAGAAIFLAWGVFLFLHWEKRTLWEGGKERGLFQGKLLAVISAFEMVFLGLEDWGQLCGLWTLLFLMAGILFLRASRLSRNISGTFFGIGFRDVAVVAFAAAILTSKTVTDGAVSLLGKAYQLLIMPVILGLLQVFLSVLVWLSPLFAGLLPEKANMDEFVSGELAAPPDFENVEMGEASVFWKVIGWLLLFALICGFLYFIFRRLSADGHGREKRPEGELLREKGAVSGETARRRTGIFGEHDVRYFYRKFLLLCKKMGLDTEKTLTTADVSHMALQYWNREETEEMRTLYLQARYGQKQEKEAEHAARRRAGELYRGMIKEIK